MNRLCPVLSVACTPSDNLPSFSSIPPPDEALAALTELILQTSPLEGLRCFCELRWTCGSGAYGSSPRPASLAAMKAWEVLGRLSVGPPYTLGKAFQPPGHTGLKIVMNASKHKAPQAFCSFIHFSVTRLPRSQSWLMMMSKVWIPVSFFISVPVIKCHDRSYFKEKGFVSAHSSGFQAVAAGKARQEATVRNREMNVPILTAQQTSYTPLTARAPN